MYSTRLTTRAPRNSKTAFSSILIDSCFIKLKRLYQIEENRKNENP